MQYTESENHVTDISYSKYEYFLSGVLESISEMHTEPTFMPNTFRMLKTTFCCHEQGCHEQNLQKPTKCLSTLETLLKITVPLTGISGSMKNIYIH